MSTPEFPITPLLPDILRTLDAHERLVLEAPPGAGKTTQVPLALLAASWRGGGKILMLEPRRVAARAAAGFMAAQLGEVVGDTVGYRIRFEKKISPATRVEVLTEGILTRMIQDDPTLEGVAAIIFDEFHERHLSGDLGLALALDVQAQLRPELRIVVMSATIDAAPVAGFLDAPILRVAGRVHPVTVDYLPQPAEALEREVPRAIRRLLEGGLDGDVLVFLPGALEIRRAMEACAPLAQRAGLLVLPLHGSLSPAEQDRAIKQAKLSNMPGASACAAWSMPSRPTAGSSLAAVRRKSSSQIGRAPCWTR